MHSLATSSKDAAGTFCAAWAFVDGKNTTGVQRKPQHNWSAAKAASLPMFSTTKKAVIGHHPIALAMTLQPKPWQTLSLETRKTPPQCLPGSAHKGTRRLNIDFLRLPQAHPYSQGLQQLPKGSREPSKVDIGTLNARFIRTCPNPNRGSSMPKLHEKSTCRMWCHQWDRLDIHARAVVQNLVEATSMRAESRLRSLVPTWGSMQRFTLRRSCFFACLLLLPFCLCICFFCSSVCLFGSVTLSLFVYWLLCRCFVFRCLFASLYLLLCFCLFVCLLACACACSCPFHFSDLTTAEVD